jgi:hypothetical protein
VLLFQKIPALPKYRAAGIFYTLSSFLKYIRFKIQ